MLDFSVFAQIFPTHFISARFHQKPARLSIFPAQSVYKLNDIFPQIKLKMAKQKMKYYLQNW